MFVKTGRAKSNLNNNEKVKRELSRKFRKKNETARTLFGPLNKQFGKDTLKI